MIKPKVLLTDDDIDILETTKFLLSDLYDIETASNVSDAKRLLYMKDIDVAVVDLNFEGHSEDGLNLMDHIQSEMPSLPVIVLSSDQDTKRVVEATRRGPTDFITKDEESEESLRSAIELALSRKKANASARASFLSESPLIKTVLQKVDRVIMSDSNAPILILGESGTGKEYLARYVAVKLRMKMVAANMASIPKETAESELFGHKKGSFTGATSDKAGLLEQAHNGLFFLDELGDCSPAIQAKLLRVIQEKEVLPVGGLAPKKINLRFVAATHQDLEKMIEEECFRNDLYQRLNTFTFRIPALRERPEDIEFYTRSFINELTNGELFRIDPQGLQIFKNHSWPGNVRELRNAVERAVVLSKRRMLDQETALEVLNKVKEKPKGPTVTKVISKNDIVEAVKMAKGNRTRAAELLNIHKVTLHRKIRDFNLSHIIEQASVGRPPAQA